MSSQNVLIDRALGAIGIVGGASLLAAFIVEVPSNLSLARLILYFVGSAAVTVALAHRGERSGLGVGVAAVAVALNVASIGMLLLSIGRERPFAGDVGLLWFWISFATWLADGAVGFVAWRQRTTWRLGAVVLAVGSILAILGMDRLGLSTWPDANVFARLALLGVGLNGIGWVLIGLDLVVGRRTRAEVVAASPA